MDTKNFNFIDKIIANLRLGKVINLVNKGDKILDFGCGANSFLLDSVKKKIKSGVGLDYDVNNSKDGNIEYVNYKFNGKLPFKKNSFDKIFLLAVLEHIEIDSVDKLFLELKRILRENGKIILTVPTPKSKKILEFLAYKLHLISKFEIRDHKKYYQKTDLISLVKRNKVKVISYQTFQFGLNSLCVIKKNK